MRMPQVGSGRDPVRDENRTMGDVSFSVGHVAEAKKFEPGIHCETAPLGKEVIMPLIEVKCDECDARFFVDDADLDYGKIEAVLRVVRDTDAHQLEGTLG